MLWFLSDLCPTAARSLVVILLYGVSVASWTGMDWHTMHIAFIWKLFHNVTEVLGEVINNNHFDKAKYSKYRRVSYGLWLRQTTLPSSEREAFIKEASGGHDDWSSSREFISFDSSMKQGASAHLPVTNFLQQPFTTKTSQQHLTRGIKCSNAKHCGNSSLKPLQRDFQIWLIIFFITSLNGSYIIYPLFISKI